MADSEIDIKFSLKAVINKQRTKVLFAEIDSDFADVLLSFLTLPLGTIIQVMDKHFGKEAPVIGSITTLRKGLSNLDSELFSTEGGKQMLLNPVSSIGCEGLKLKFDISGSQQTKYFRCENWGCTASAYIGMYNDTNRCGCRKQLKKEIHVRNPGGNIAFAVSTATFIVTDELEIMPNVTASVLQILSDLGIADLGYTVVMNVSFGFNKIVDLLKLSLLSETPLSDIILNGRIKYQPGISLYPTDLKVASNYSPGYFRAGLKVILHKSTDKFLFAEAEEDFIEFLFSLLTIPLGGVECLLGSNTHLKNIDNLYRSIAGFNKYMHLRMQNISSLINPKIPHGYLSKNHILPLTEEGAPQLYYSRSGSQDNDSMCWNPYPNSTKNYTLIIPKGNEVYVRSPRSYMVRDDLTVTPLCMTSYMSTLTGLKISLSDVEERLLNVGPKEVLVTWFIKTSKINTILTEDGFEQGSLDSKTCDLTTRPQLTYGVMYFESITYLNMCHFQWTTTLVEERAKARTMRLVTTFQ